MEKNFFHQQTPLALLALVGAAYLVPSLGLDLIPTVSQGEFSFRIELPEGTPLEATDRFVAQIQSVLEDDAAARPAGRIGAGPVQRQAVVDADAARPRRNRDDVFRAIRAKTEATIRVKAKPHFESNFLSSL